MGYGYGVGFVKATPDIPIVNLRLSPINMSAGMYVNFKVMGTNTNYSVPSGKTGLIALFRATQVDEIRTGDITLGYADDASGTNFVALASQRDLGISSAPTEVYWIFRIPAGKFIGLKNTGSNSTTAEAGIIVLFEV
jgi:hypothetical protein